MKLNEINDSLSEISIPYVSRNLELRKQRKAGKKDFKATVNNLENEFFQFLGISNKKISNADYTDLLQFLKKKGVSSDSIDQSVPFSKKRARDIFTKLSRDAMLSSGSDKKKPKKSKTKEPEFKSQRNKKMKLPADVVSSVGNLSTDQKLALAQAIQNKYGQK